ncbi:hypothetical protein OGAPHI_002675 [Ogataea philodendri]|uniref:Uncharacterized protein n=1 Tax=Ogataea philodendri TaxID=1378263 RepID=A0A9P8PC79_9ASCO|nr:uncharacterized protein OGAPHI_002675 [Ogataea philodendri]KAH3668920.1 hypothetical protein OGAPHI_002675 [Ogataea philodendri]
MITSCSTISQMNGFNNNEDDFESLMTISSAKFFKSSESFSKPFGPRRNGTSCERILESSVPGVRSKETRRNKSCAAEAEACLTLHSLFPMLSNKSFNIASKLSVTTLEFGRSDVQISFIVLATDGLGSNLYLKSFGINRDDSLSSLAIKFSSLVLSRIAPNPNAIPFLEDQRAEFLARDMNL